MECKRRRRDSWHKFIAVGKAAKKASASIRSAQSGKKSPQPATFGVIGFRICFVIRAKSVPRKQSVLLIP